LKASKKISFRDDFFYVFDDVYEPAEDTFLIARHLRVSGYVLEIGTGCGILSILAAHKANHVVATDINPSAAECAKLNAKTHGVSEKIDILVGDLFRPIRENCTFNTILFNAPYLPDEKKGECKSKGLIDYAWSGGKDGRKLIDRFLQEAPKHLKPGGNILLIQSTLSGMKKTLRELRRQGLQVRTIDKLKVFFETIILIEAVKPIESIKRKPQRNDPNSQDGKTD